MSMRETAQQSVRALERSLTSLLLKVDAMAARDEMRGDIRDIVHRVKAILGYESDHPDHATASFKLFSVAQELVFTAEDVKENPSFVGSFHELAELLLSCLHDFIAMLLPDAASTQDAGASTPVPHGGSATTDAEASDGTAHADNGGPLLPASEPFVDKQTETELLDAFVRLLNGIDVGHRRYRFGHAGDCFVGAEALRWLHHSGIYPSQRACVLALTRMMRSKFFRSMEVGVVTFDPSFTLYQVNASHVAALASEAASVMMADINGAIANSTSRDSVMLTLIVEQLHDDDSPSGRSSSVCRVNVEADTTVRKLLDQVRQWLKTNRAQSLEWTSIDSWHLWTQDSRLDKPNKPVLSYTSDGSEPVLYFRSDDTVSMSNLPKDKDTAALVRFVRARCAAEKAQQLVRIQAMAATAAHVRDGVLRVLSLDGGGMKSMLHFTVLERLQELAPGTLERCDMFVASSISGFIAVGLAFGYSIAFLRGLLEHRLLFRKKTVKNVKSATYKHKYWKVLCTELFGQATLADIPRYVYIPVFRIIKSASQNSWNLEVMHNLPNSTTADTPVVDVILRSISLPTVFPSYQGYCDGGLVATNPALTALGHILGVNALNRQPKNVAMISLGSGRVIRYIADATHDWGMVQWAPKITNVLQDGMGMYATQLCQLMLQDAYHRLNPVLEFELTLGDIPKLLALCEETTLGADLSETLAWLKHYFAPSHNWDIA